ncbi:probable RNA helicase armi [Maniola jurtina]|uniref:probable RNA helicase armi n=1 Tax=Maniola jurtina TaxID=191418 RepID=UPI001E689804|nr:probable RNA helicase armi [Maniola jurtina]
MLSYITSFFNYLFGKDHNEESDEDMENFLAEELLALQIQAEKETKPAVSTPVREPPRNAVCFQKTGLITYCGENYILIDGMIFHDMTGSTVEVNVNDKVLYLCYKDSNDSVVVVRILENQGLFWGDEAQSEEKSFSVIEHILVGQVDHRQDRSVFITEGDLKFNLDEVEGTFVPIQGDWLEMKCSVQQDEDKPADMSANQVLKVISFNPIRTKVKSAIVTDWSGADGVCDRQIYFNKTALVNSIQPTIGTKVLVEAIESTQGGCNWRAIKLIVIDAGSPTRPQVEISNEEQISLKIENEKKLEMTYPLKFEQVNLHCTEKIMLNICNKSNQTYILNKWMVLSKKRDSQVNIKPFLNQPIIVNPEQTVTFTITCNPKFLGNSKECFVVLFKGFQLKRFIEINVVDGNNTMNCNVDNGLTNLNYERKWSDKVESMRKIRNNANPFIPGERPCKTPNFVSVKLGHFPIPDKIWSIVLGDSEQTLYTNEYHKILSNIENRFPCLAQELNIANYIDRWHTLIYLEEIQANINMRAYDKSKVYLTHCDEYLGIEMPGLAEKRPSLIKGDRVIVTDTWASDAPQYEGFIHSVRGNFLLMKFNLHFHETYGGSDVSIEFHLLRTIYRRAHHAINLALSNLGPDILFPSRLIVKPLQIPPEDLDKIEWFNQNLNKHQKNAISNILKGECRPMPYIIFGPPGTGKTVTVIETILQILRCVPESRILVATPSNSASNLITERLIQYKGKFTGSVVRLIATYLVDSDSIPEVIKPYCATIDIAIERTSRNRHFVKDNINLNCSKSLIGRHRVTIGTCYCLGALKHLDLPRGHFTHIIVDEAGQATEPEIMIPLTFTDKEHGQIVLAGDPMQLGPVIMSKYCKEFGMDESFLARLLDRFPYLKDYEAYEDGFDRRLVTKLNDNYRSLKEVLTLPSELFYDGTLVPKIDKSLPWTRKFITATSEIFDLQSHDGGIFVYGIKGVNMRDEDSPSWYNPQEASMVALTTCKLYKKNLTADEIGIITPYIAQTKYLRVVFDSMGLPQPKIGTVEDFQGQERPVILISTVRSNEAIIEEDIKHYLGFVNNPKRLNVALTRAHVSTIIFCNPHLLSIDPLWNRVIAHTVANEKYMGCDLPIDYENSNNV